MNLIMQDFLMLFIINFIFLTIFIEIGFKPAHLSRWSKFKLYSLLTFLVSIFLIIFGRLTNSAWTFISTIIAFGTVVTSEDTIEKIFGIEKNLYITRCLTFVRLMILLITPIMYASVYIIDKTLIGKQKIDLVPYISVSLFRLLFMEIIVFLLILLYKGIDKLTPHGLLGQLFVLSKNNSILNGNQGFWYEVGEYPISHSKYLKSEPSFNIFGSLFLRDKEAYRIKALETSFMIEDLQEELVFKDEGVCFLNGKTFIGQNSIFFKKKYRNYSKSNNRLEKNAYYFFLESDFNNKKGKNEPDLIYKIKDGTLFELRTRFPNFYTLTNWNIDKKIVQGTINNSKAALGNYEFNQENSKLTINGINYILKKRDTLNVK